MAVSSSAASSLLISAKASSTDANPAQAAYPVAVTSFWASANPATVAYGTGDTLTATGLSSTATGTVTFTSGGATLCTATLPSATCSTGTSLARGSYPVTAAYSGDGNYSAQSATTSFTVTAASTTLSAGRSDASVSHGSPDTLSFSGLPAYATGSVVFTSGGTTLCTVSDVTAATSCTTPATLAVGTYPVTATYSGSSNYTGSTATTSFAVTRVAATLTAGRSDPSVSYGSSDTLSFSGLPANATGSVVFTSGGTTLCTVSDVTAATSCTTPTTLAVGTYPVTATYSGDSNTTGATSSTTFDVTHNGSASFTAGSSDPSVVYGSADTLTFSGLTPGATGSVTFTAGGTTLCTVADVTTASSCTTPTTLAVGTYPVSATYSGDANNTAATSTTTFDVTTAATTITAGRSDASVSYGSPDTLSFSGLPANATGSVVFTAGGHTLCTVTDITTATSCTTPTTLAAGTYPVSATYSGDANTTGATATTTFDVTAAATTVTADASDPYVSYGSPDTLSFSGLPVDATGSVTFTAGGHTLCTVTDITTATSCTTPTTLAAGTYLVSATYSGDANYTAATDTTTFDVTAAATTLTAGPSDPSIVHGSPDTLSFSGLPADATGSVTFTADGHTLCTVSDVTTATSCTTPTDLDVGTYPVTATYSGDDDYTGSTTSTTFDVTASGSSGLTAGRSDPSVSYGSPDTLAFSGLAADATGSVVFTADGHTLCTVDDITTATSCTTPTDLDVDTYPVTATYSGDHNHSAATASTSFDVTKAATGITAGRSDPSVSYGSPDTLAFSGLAADATGSVVFTADGHTLCTVDDITTATSCTTPTDLDVDTYPVTATYSGDANYTASTDTTTFDVTAAATILTAGASDPSVVYGSPDTLSFSGLPGDATGSVTFTADGRTLCTISDVTAATSCTTPTDLDAGTYPVTATYSGDANYTASTATTTFDVTAASTTVTAAASDPSVVYGSADTLTFGGLTPDATGSVTFTTGGHTLCTVTDITTATSCTTPTTLAAGTYPVTATYSGDANTTGATATTTFDVTAVATTLTAGPSDPAVSYGSPDTLSFSGLPAEATGSVTFTTGGHMLCTVDDITAATSCTTPTDLAVGTYPVTATYSGDHNTTASTATTTFDVTAVATTLTAGPSDPAVSYGSPDTLSFSGLPADATGSVTLTTGGHTLCTITDITTASSCTTPTDLAVGSYPVTATYSGDATYTGATATTSFTVAVAPTDTFAITVGLPTVAYGSADTLSFSGLPTGATGSVTFTAAGVTLCTIADIHTTSTCTTSTLLPGTYNVGGVYSGDDNYAASNAMTTFTVDRSPTEVIASVTAADNIYGTTDTLSFSGLPTGATGTVTFTSAATTLCVVADITAASSCSPPADLSVGRYPVLATYSGDGRYLPSHNSTGFTVEAASTTMTATALPASVAYGHAATLTVGGLPADATGTVTFTANGHTLCTVHLPDTGCPTATRLPVGTYPVTATHSGDANHAPATASTEFTVLRAAPSRFTAAATPARISYGTRDTLSLAGLPADATGTVTFTARNVTLCKVTLPRAVSCQAPAALAVGTYAITASYSGDTNHDPATTSTGLVVGKAATDINANAVTTTVTRGAAQTYTVAGLPSAATGTVVFTSGGVTLCTVHLPVASCRSSTVLAVGTHTITAAYSGDADHAPSTTHFTLTVLSNTVSTSTSTGSRLAYTGMDIGLYVLTALGLLIGGVGVARFARRRSA